MSFQDKWPIEDMDSLTDNETSTLALKKTFNGEASGSLVRVQSLRAAPPRIVWLRAVDNELSFGVAYAHSNSEMQYLSERILEKF